MRPEEFGVITTTVAEAADADRLAALLLTEKLAACVQIMRVESRYVWKGETNHTPEFMLLIKTRASLFGAVTEKLMAEHPYETPEIVATPFIAGLPAYLDWMEESTKAPQT
ncbi:MAG TPA: divalent-cation tolerance protein CutA [Rhizomicrobium sp.]|nr:divalent-cation tolerance protein CutA [Rhizomicrobium sp.]